MIRSSAVKYWELLVFSGAFFLMSGCATYQSKTHESQQLIRSGKVEESLEKLKSLAEVEDRDQLVHVMDYATALQIAGRFKESSDVFIKADKMVDLNDYHSVSNIVGATLGGEEMVQYKGESYEKFFINTLNSINFLMMGLPDDALVEARRINEKLQKMKMDGRAPYEMSPFARYLAALVWESERKFDDAYLEYDGSYQLDPRNSFLAADLIRSSKLSRRDDSYQKWKKSFPQVEEKKEWYDKAYGELIFVFQQGMGAQKTNRPGSYRFPMLKPVANETLSAHLKIFGYEPIQTEVLYDVDAVAIATLERDFGALMARRVGGIAAKAIISDQIRQKNELLGDLTWIAMNLADRADLRQWSLLPAKIQMARVFLRPGTYRVSAQGLRGDKSPSSEVMDEKEIRVVAGKKTFVSWRSVK